MRTEESTGPRGRKPLDSARLDELALSYVGRFATTRAKLVAYLTRKLRERGWEDAAEPQPAAIAERFVELGYIDDAAWARGRSDGLLRRGYGPRRVAQALGAAGIDEAVRGSVRPEEAAARGAAIAFARRRGLGPFGPDRPDRDRRQKQLAAMVRAGHGFETARALVDATSVAAAEAWAAEARES
jgi:regulatory protein